MINNLVIVESPAKAKTIERFLGKDFHVASSMGHIRDLSKKDFGIDIENNYKPEYIVPGDKKKIVADLKKLVKDAKTVWLASDEDREGESIVWHLLEVLKPIIGGLPLRHPFFPPRYILSFAASTRVSAVPGDRRLTWLSYAGETCRCAGLGRRNTTAGS